MNRSAKLIREISKKIELRNIIYESEYLNNDGITSLEFLLSKQARTFHIDIFEDIIYVCRIAEPSRETHHEFIRYRISVRLIPRLRWILGTHTP